MNPLLFPPALIKRALDDLGAIGDAARRLPSLERQVLERVDRIAADAFARVDALHEELVSVRRGVEGLQVEMAPIQQLPAMREAVSPLDGRLAAMQAQLDGLAEQMEPLKQLQQVREGIEPLDEDMRAVRDAIDDLEPLVRQIAERIEAMQRDLGPLGELADKIPGVGS